MTKREPIGKKARFEVFKRDRFTCQYCGSKAPDVVLHVDHIHPVAQGGGNDILNLVTACQGCNAGKGARLIDDTSAMERQREQMAILESRREQLQMMLQWRDELEQVKIDTVQMIADRVADRGEFYPNENGHSHIRRWLKRYSFDEVLSAADEAFDIYMKWSNSGKPDQDAWEKAFAKIPGICSIRRQSDEKPYLKRLFYVQGILRKRFRDRNGRYVQAMEEMILEWGADENTLENLAKISDSWEHFNELVISAVTPTQERIDG